VYDWHLKNADIKQRLYLNESASKMLEVIQDRIAILWEHEPVAGIDIDVTFISWTKSTLIPKFPFFAAQVSSLPYFISSDFKFMCNFNYQTKRMRVRETESGRTIGSLPREAIHMSSDLDQID